MDDGFAIPFTVIEIGAQYALLKSDDEKIGNIVWPKENLPQNIKIGEKIELMIRDRNKQNTDEQYEVMRKLLQDLVN